MHLISAFSENSELPPKIWPSKSISDHCHNHFVVVVTWQEDTPEAPAQIMASVILL